MIESQSPSTDRFKSVSEYDSDIEFWEDFNKAPEISVPLRASYSNYPISNEPQSAAFIESNSHGDYPRFELSPSRQNVDLERARTANKIEV
jgi:hypothetical protein